MYYTGCEDFENIVSIDVGEMYEWDEIEIFYSASRRRYFWISGAGCSCDYLYNGVSSIEDFENGDYQSAVRALKEYSSDSNADIHSELNDLRKFNRNLKKAEKNA